MNPTNSDYQIPEIDSKTAKEMRSQLALQAAQLDVIQAKLQAQYQVILLEKAKDVK